MTKTYHTSLIVEVLACIRVDDDCPKDTIGTIARESISLFSTDWRNVSLEIERIEVDDIVEITQESNDAG